MRWRPLDRDTWDALRASCLDAVLAAMPQAAHDDGIMTVGVNIQMSGAISEVVDGSESSMEERAPSSIYMLVCQSDVWRCMASISTS